MNEDTKGSLPTITGDSNFRITLSKMNRYMGFIGVVVIIYGALACLSIIGALIGIPCIFMGIRLRQAADSFNSYSRSGADSELRTAIEQQTRFFLIQYILTIIGIVCFAIYIIIIAVIVVGSVGTLSSAALLGSERERTHGATVSSWSPGFTFPWSKTYAISAATRKILKNLDDVVTIKVFISQKLPPNLGTTVSAIKGTIAKYKACAGRKIRIIWVDPAASETMRSEAKSLGIPEIQLQTFEKDAAQVMNGYLGIAVLYADRKESLPVVQNIENLEYELSCAIVKVSRSVMPKIGILKVDTAAEYPPQVMRQMSDDAKKERTEEKFKPLFETLNESYDVAAIDVSRNAPIGNDVTTLVIPGCAPLDDRGLFEVDQYFMHGGNLIVLAGSMRVDFGTYGPAAKNVDSKLFDLLQFYGVKVERNMVLDASCGQVQVPQKVGLFTMNVAVSYPYFVRVGSEGLNREIPPVASLSEVIMPWPNSITPLVKLASLNTKTSKRQEASEQPGIQPVTAIILAHSSKKSWTASNPIDLNPQQKWEPPATVKSFILAVYMHGNFKSYFAGKSIPPDRKKTSGPADADRTFIAANPDGHCIVIANTDFISAQNGTPANIMMVSNLVDWLSLDPNLLSIRPKPIKKSETANVEESLKN